MTIIAAADGSALGNPGPAGWAWYVDDSCWAAGGWPRATNNQGELMAVIDLFERTAAAGAAAEPLKVLCDSQYVINTVTKWMPGWKRKGWRKADGAPVLNVELVKRLDEAIAGREYTFEWVKGHAGHDLNEAADSRARAAATAYQKGSATIPSGPGFSRGAAAELPPASPTPTTSVLTDAAPAALSLFDELDTLPAEPDEDVVLRLERQLLRTGDASLLHPDFDEFGATEGTRITRVISAATVADGVVLLGYEGEQLRGPVLCSSLWLRGGGVWRLRFHQTAPRG